jgi:hypothetical protein
MPKFIWLLGINGYRMDNKLIISQTECELLKLKVGRLNLIETFKPEDLVFHFEQNGLDILRIRIENPERNIYSLLDQLPYKYYLLNVSQIFEFGGNVLISNKSGISFKNYFPVDRHLMKEIVRKSFANHDGSYYFNPRVKGIYSNLDELNSMVEYISDQYHNENKRWTKLVYFEGVAVGFVSYILDENLAQGDMFGVLPEFQQLGIGKEIGIYVVNEIGVNRVIRNNVQIQQIKSLNLHYSLGMKPVGINVNFHLTNI